MHYTRILDMRLLSQQKSLVLFGPRSTGKTTLLREQFSSEALVNLPPLLDEVHHLIERMLFSLDENNRQTSDGIRILHWSCFLKGLWANDFF